MKADLGTTPPLSSASSRPWSAAGSGPSSDGPTSSMPSSARQGSPSPRYNGPWAFNLGADVSIRWIRPYVPCPFGLGKEASRQGADAGQRVDEVPDVPQLELVGDAGGIVAGDDERLFVRAESYRDDVRE